MTTDYATPPGRFAALLAALHPRTGQRVVVLVDEYDKPILDALETPDIARSNRNFLRGLYLGRQGQRRPRSVHVSSPV